jgi:hypothetical protein
MQETKKWEISGNHNQKPVDWQLLWKMHGSN